MEVSVRALVRYLVTGEGGGRVSVRSGGTASAISLRMFFVLLSDGTGYDTFISSPAHQFPSRLSKRPTRMSTLLIGSVSVPSDPLPLPPPPPIIMSLGRIIVPSGFVHELCDGRIRAIAQDPSLWFHHPHTRILSPPNSGPFSRPARTIVSASTQRPAPVMKKVPSIRPNPSLTDQSIHPSHASVDVRLEFVAEMYEVSSGGR